MCSVSSPDRRRRRQGHCGCLPRGDGFMTIRGIHPFLIMGTYWTPCALHRLCTRPMSKQKSYFSVAGRPAVRRTGDRHGPRMSLLSAYQGNPAGLSYGTTMGDITGQCSMEPWHVNCAIRCSGTTVEPCRLHRVRGCQVWLPRAVHAQWAEVRTLHFFPGRGCTHSAHHSEPV